MKHDSLATYLKKNSLPIFLQVLSLLALIANLWLASKLSPLAKDIAVITTRVSANETIDAQQHPTFVTHEQIKREVTERLDRIEGKLDRVIENRR